MTKMAQPIKKMKMLVKARRTISEVCGGRSWDSLLSTDKPQWRRRSFTTFTTRRRDQNNMKAKSSKTRSNAAWKRCATSGRMAKNACILSRKNLGLSGAAESGAIKCERNMKKTWKNPLAHNSQGLLFVNKAGFNLESTSPYPLLRSNSWNHCITGHLGLGRCK